MENNGRNIVATGRDSSYPLTIEEAAEHYNHARPAPLLLAFIIGRMMEENFRRAMLYSHGDILVFAQSPICIALLGAAALLMAVLLAPSLRSTRQDAFSG